MSGLVEKTAFANEFVKQVHLDLEDIKHSFFKIGFRLLEADQNAYYITLGYSSITECAEALFNIKKSTTYELMKICLLFQSNEQKMIIDKRYEKFNQSQLALFSSIKCRMKDFIDLCSPDDSIAKLRKASKYWRGITNSRMYGGIGWAGCKNIDEFIENVESVNPHLREPPKKDIIVPEEKTKLLPGEPGYLLQEAKKMPKDPTLEQSLEMLGKIINNPSKADTSEKVLKNENGDTEENSGCPEKFTDILVKECSKAYDYTGYKTIWDPDNKGHGLRVLGDHLSEVFVEKMLRSIQDNRTAVKHQIQKYVTNRMSDFRYEVTLCGRKQGIPTLCGNMAGWILDFLCEEWQSMLPEKEKKKK